MINIIFKVVSSKTLKLIIDEESDDEDYEEKSPKKKVARTPQSRKPARRTPSKKKGRPPTVKTAKSK